MKHAPLSPLILQVYESVIVFNFYKLYGLQFLNLRNWRFCSCEPANQTKSGHYLQHAPCGSLPNTLATSFRSILLMKSFMESISIRSRTFITPKQLSFGFYSFIFKMDVWRPFRRPFRDLHFCFRESKFKTRASASFRAVDFFSISLEVLPRSHRELPRKLFLGVAWKCVICICWWAGHSDNVFGCTGWRVKNTYYIKVIHSDFELHRWHIHVTF